MFIAEISLSEVIFSDMFVILISILCNDVICVLILIWSGSDNNE